MIFNDQHLVIIDSLNYAEASAFIKFLQSEIIRHRDDMRQAEDLIELIRCKHTIFERNYHLE